MEPCFFFFPIRRHQPFELPDAAKTPRNDDESPHSECPMITACPFAKVTFVPASRHRKYKGLRILCYKNLSMLSTLKQQIFEYELITLGAPTDLCVRISS